MPRPSGVALGGGIAMLYLSLVVLIPLAAVVSRAFDNGLASFWDAVTGEQAMAALRLTIGVSFAVVAINALTGTLIAWVLVRDDFRGKAFVNALIDLPFALPTIVAGLTLLALYGPRGPVGIDVAYTRCGGPAGAPVRDAAVRGARGAAGADGARPRHGGGRRLARREQLHDLPAHHPAEPDAGDPRRGRARVRARRSASSARSC